MSQASKISKRTLKVSTLQELPTLAVRASQPSHTPPRFSVLSKISSVDAASSQIEESVSSVHNSSIILDESSSALNQLENKSGTISALAPKTSSKCFWILIPAAVGRKTVVEDIGFEPAKLSKFIVQEEQRLTRKQSFKSFGEQESIDHKFLLSIKNPKAPLATQNSILGEEDPWSSRLKVFDKYVVSTSTTQYQVYKLVYIFMCFVSSFDYAFQATFREHPMGFQVYFFEFFFLASLFFTFITEYHYPTSEKIERQVFFLFKIYWRGRLLWDIAALLPLHSVLGIFLPPEYCRLALLIKLTRLSDGFQRLERKQYIKQIKQYFNQRISDIIENDNERAGNDTIDSTFIHQIVFMGYTSRTCYLIGFILSFSFIIGLLWFNLSDFLKREGEDDFIKHNDCFSYISNQGKSLVLTYFVFTTVSTVGFGDYHPISDAERFIGAFILLFGVAITSYIMENLNKMISSINSLYDDFEQTEQLSLFFGTLERFNGDEKLNPSLQEFLGSYFEYRWSNDKNFAVSTQEDADLLAQLPQKVQNEIFTQFLFKDFIKVYRKIFESLVPNTDELGLQIVRSNSESSHGTSSQFSKMPATQIDTDEVQNTCLMLQSLLLRNLEPLKLPPRSILQKRTTEVSQVVYLMDGELEVGYNHWYFMVSSGILSKMTNQSFPKVHHALSRQSTMIADDKFQFPLSLKPGVAVGSFELTFDKRSQFIFRTGEEACNSFFIRRKNWRDFIEQLEEITDTRDQFQKQVLRDYVTQVALPIQRYQQEMTSLEKQKRQSREVKKREALALEQIHLKNVYKDPASRRKRQQTRRKSLLLLTSLFKAPSTRPSNQSELTSVQKHLEQSPVPLPHRTSNFSGLMNHKVNSKLDPSMNRSQYHHCSALFASEVKDDELRALVSKVFDTSMFEVHSENLSQFQSKQDMESLPSSVLFNYLLAKIRISERRIEKLVQFNKDLGEVVDHQQKTINTLKTRLRRSKLKSNMESPLGQLVRNEELKNFGQHLNIDSSFSESIEGPEIPSASQVPTDSQQISQNKSQEIIGIGRILSFSKVDIIAQKEEEKTDEGFGIEIKQAILKEDASSTNSLAFNSGSQSYKREDSENCEPLRASPAPNVKVELLQPDEGSDLEIEIRPEPQEQKKKEQRRTMTFCKEQQETEEEEQKSEIELRKKRRTSRKGIPYSSNSSSHSKDDPPSRYSSFAQITQAQQLPSSSAEEDPPKNEAFGPFVQEVNQRRSSSTNQEISSGSIDQQTFFNAMKKSKLEPPEELSQETIQSSEDSDQLKTEEYIKNLLQR